MSDLTSLYNTPMGISMPADMRQHRRATGPAASASNGAPLASVNRKSFTDRLGLPEDATNDEVLGAFDELMKPKPAPAATTLTDDQFYIAMFGDGSSARPAPVTAEDRLYDSMFGR